MAVRHSGRSHREEQATAHGCAAGQHQLQQLHRQRQSGPALLFLRVRSCGRYGRLQTQQARSGHHARHLGHEAQQAEEDFEPLVRQEHVRRLLQARVENHVRTGRTRNRTTQKHPRKS